ncbi:MAG: hypothetical protein ACREMD_12810 [Gemmatimonadota bacterium]
MAEFRNLDQSVNYTAGLEHVDTRGGRSSRSTILFSTGAGQAQCPPMIGITVLAGRPA